MKGMLDFLERAGLVKKDEPAVPPDAAVGPGGAATDGAPLGSDSPAPVPAVPAAGVATALNLKDIYAEQGVGPALDPAERLLRLVDGLSAMDEATRQMAIKAMDAADEPLIHPGPAGRRGEGPRTDRPQPTPAGPPATTGTGNPGHSLTRWRCARTKWWETSASRSVNSKHSPHVN